MQARKGTHMDRFEPDVPEADRVEQVTPAGAPDEPEDAETSASTDSLEVNEADAAEQRRSVPDEDEYPHG